MRWTPVVLAAALVFSRVAAADDDDVWREQSRKSVDVGGMVALDIHNNRGRVDLVPSSDGRLHITALKIVRRGSREDAQKLARQMLVEVGPRGDRYVVEVQYQKRQHIRVGFQDMFRFERRVFPRSEVRITAEVPAGLAVSVRATSGDIRSEGLTGPQVLKSSSGDIEVEAAGSQVVVTTSSGDVSATGLRAARLSSASGDLEVREVAGPLRASTSSGDISVKGARDSLDLNSRSGDIVADAAPRGLSGESSSGDVVVRGVAGAVRVGTGSGDVRLDLREPLRDVDVRTSSGQIRLSLDPAVRCALELRTSSGSLDVDLPLDMRQASRRTLSGTIRGGKTPVLLHTASGDITVMGGGR